MKVDLRIVKPENTQVRNPNSTERRRTPGRRLTDRQAVVLDLVASGLGNKEIAHRLGISEQAVKEHVSTLLRVLAAPNRAALGDAAAQLRFTGTFDLDPAWLRFLFTEAPLYVAVVAGPDHRFVAANEAVRAGSPEALIGRPYAEVFPNREQPLALLDEAYRTGERVVRTNVPRHLVLRPGGQIEERYVSVVLQPLPDETGATAGVAVFSIDVTDAVIAERRVHELEKEELALLDLLSTGVIILDTQGDLVKANAAARQLISIPEPPVRITPELAGAYALRDASDGREIAFDEIPTIRALRGEACREPIVYRVRDPEHGSERLLRVSAMPLVGEDGRPRGSVTTFSEA